MSSGGGPPQESEPQSGENEAREARGRRQNAIEFVDSQDPNVRSAIQRHTAYHSAAQRRDARSRLLRRSSQSRYLEWGRRPRLDTDVTTSSASSASSVSISPAPSMSERPEHQGQTSSSTQAEQESDRSTSRSASIPGIETMTIVPPAMSEEDSILQFCKSHTFLNFFRYNGNANISFLDSSTFCQHSQFRDLFDMATTFMREHEASRHLLLAYAYATRWKMNSSPETVQDQVDAQAHFGRGTNILWNRLRISGHASSDANIQAVMILIAYTSDFGQPREVSLHADALRTMVEQRGGIDAFGHNPALQQQLWQIERSREFHLTLGCEDSCTSALRFPDGLRLRPDSEAG